VIEIFAGDLHLLCRTLSPGSGKGSGEVRDAVEKELMESIALPESMDGDIGMTSFFEAVMKEVARECGRIAYTSTKARQRSEMRTTS
jgi:hypothetical protein